MIQILDIVFSPGERKNEVKSEIVRQMWFCPECVDNIWKLFAEISMKSRSHRMPFVHIWVHSTYIHASCIGAYFVTAQVGSYYRKFQTKIAFNAESPLDNWTFWDKYQFFHDFSGLYLQIVKKKKLPNISKGYTYFYLLVDFSNDRDKCWPWSRVGW